MHTFIIAEAGVNHNGQDHLAYELVDAAVAAGADAIKFQTFSADKVVQKTAGKASYQKDFTGEGTQHAMLKALEMSPDLHRGLMKYCAENGIEFMSTPFDFDAADFLVAEGIQRMKIPSGEVTNHPFIRHLAGLGRPLILSTGMADMDDINQAVDVLRAHFTAGPLEENLTILHCTSNYPTAPEDANLRAMNTIAEATGLPVGYSDHTLGIAVCPAAVAMGAQVIEKHFTLDRSMKGPDHAASLEPAELKTMVEHVRIIEAALGSAVKAPTASEAEMRIVARRSIVAARDLAVGDVLTAEDLGLLRPAVGLAPKHWDGLIGVRVKQSVAAGDALQWSDVDREPS